MPVHPSRPALDSSRLFVPGLLLIGLVCLAASGYCFWKWREDRREARRAEAARLESGRLRDDRLRRARQELEGAGGTLVAAIDARLWPAPADLDRAAAAVQAAEAAAAEVPDVPAMRSLIQGFRAFGAADIEAAKGEFKRAQVGVAEPVARYALGRALLDEGQIMEASAQFGGALHARKEWPAARFFSAVSDLDLEFEKRALPELEKAAQRWPDAPEVLEALSRCLIRIPVGGDKAKAVEAITRAIERGMRDERVLENWVRLGSDPKLSGVVATKLDLLLAAEPDSAILHLARGRLLRNAGETRPAVAEYARAVALEPVSGRRARLELAAVYLEAGQAKDSLTLVEPAAAAAPDDPELKAYVAYALRQMGKDDEARQHFSESCRDGFYWSCEEACSLRDIDSCYYVRGDAAKVLIAEILNDLTREFRDEFVREYERRQGAAGSRSSAYYRSGGYAGSQSRHRRQVHTVSGGNSPGSTGRYYTPSYPSYYSEPTYRRSW